MTAAAEYRRLLEECLHRAGTAASEEERSTYLAASAYHRAAFSTNSNFNFSLEALDAILKGTGKLSETLRCRQALGSHGATEPYLVRLTALAAANLRLPEEWNNNQVPDYNLRTTGGANEWLMTRLLALSK